ncbi:DUF5715 family protein [Petrimonas mucosa]|jgi:hypothetical protein|uniref:DUF5715 family protein n=1 Tax=Petrimonas mucosa TaxID=1642646 RepID=UPI0023F4484F|nr:DUF5715 family protein [Petrimonas mucosa]MDD3560237.1 DUF5715 family protein [Petrimonas mucosa]
MRSFRRGVLLLSLFLIVCCGRDKTSGNAEGSELPKTARGIPLERKRRFTGNYNREFNDLQDLHLKAALAAGISPLASRDDTLKLANELVRLPNELELYKMYELTHSIPFLVPSAAQLFIDIAQNFRDSLYSKELPLYRIYVSSLLRTDEDLSRLTRGNINASENSAHRYGTTFDISWKLFNPVMPDSTHRVPPERLKLVLAQVLFDLKGQQRCYVKHERKQACFHITVRTE